MKTKDVRWKQRFQNFEKTYVRLKEAMELEELTELERNGLIQRFEFTLDLSWKVMKDFLEEKDLFSNLRQYYIFISPYSDVDALRSSSHRKD